MQNIQKKAFRLTAMLAFSTILQANTCEYLTGDWSGEWDSSTRLRQTTVTFTNVGASGFFQGFYLFSDQPDVQVSFSGKCIDSEYGYWQLSFQGGDKPNICSGLLNSSGELWMECPFNHSSGIYHKKS